MLTQVLQVQEIKKSLLALNFLIKSVWRALMAPRRPSLNFHQISTVWSIPDSLSCTKKILALHLTGTWQKMTTTDWYRGLKIRVRGDFFFFFSLLVLCHWHRNFCRLSYSHTNPLPPLPCTDFPGQKLIGKEGKAQGNCKSLHQC